jgi:hypothetical protein
LSQAESRCDLSINRSLTETQNMKVLLNFTTTPMFAGPLALGQMTLADSLGDLLCMGF